MYLKILDIYLNIEAGYLFQTIGTRMCKSNFAISLVFEIPDFKAKFVKYASMQFVALSTANPSMTEW